MCCRIGRTRWGGRNAWFGYFTSMLIGSILTLISEVYISSSCEFEPDITLQHESSKFLEDLMQLEANARDWNSMEMSRKTVQEC